MKFKRGKVPRVREAEFFGWSLNIIFSTNILRYGSGCLEARLVTILLKDQSTAASFMANYGHRQMTQSRQGIVLRAWVGLGVNAQCH